MNVILQHDEATFTEENPSSKKLLPLAEQIECQAMPGYDGIIFKFQLPGGSPRHPNPIDSRQMNRLLAYLAPREGTTRFVGSWKFVDAKREDVMDETGRMHEQVTYEQTFFVLKGPKSSLALRLQSVEDHNKIILCPKDQTRDFNARWKDDVELEFVLAGIHRAASPLDEEINKLSVLDDADLRSLAPQVKIQWDTTTSRDENIKRIAEARLAKRNRAAAPKPQTPEPATP